MHTHDSRRQRKAADRWAKGEARDRDRQRQHELELAKLQAKERARERKSRERIEKERLKRQAEEDRRRQANNNSKTSVLSARIRGKHTKKPNDSAGHKPTGQPVLRIIAVSTTIIRRTVVKGSQAASGIYATCKEQIEERRAQNQERIEDKRSWIDTLKPQPSPKRLPDSERITTLNAGADKIDLFNDKDKKGNEENIYKILEVCRGDRFGKIKSSFHRLRKKYHPDLYADLGAGYTSMANYILTVINAAFDEIKKRYGEK